MPSGRGWVPSSATRWTQRSRASRTILSYTRSATEERGVRFYDDFPTFFGIDRTTPSWWSSRLRSRQARSPFYPRSTSQAHLNSRRRRRGDFLGARHAGLRIGCIFCLAPPRFAESPCRNIEYFCLRKALRNQQVVGSSPTAGSRNSTTHATASTTLDSSYRSCAVAFERMPSGW